MYGPYSLCGWRIRSALSLPELSLWPAESCTASQDIQILRGPDLTSTFDAFTYELEPAGTFLLQLPGLATYRVSSDATTVMISCHPEADLQLLRAHLYGSILAVLCFGHGLLPLHGACVSLGKNAVIFTGASGRGKSTMAAAFARSGYRVLCDDVCGVELLCGQAQVWPAFPRLKLLPDAIEAFCLDTDTLYTQAAKGIKGHFLLDQPEMDHPCAALPIAALYLIEDNDGDEIDFLRLRGAAGFLAVREQIHRSNMGATLGMRAEIFRDLSDLLTAVPVFRLSRPRNLTRIADVVQAVARRHPQAIGDHSV